jgi:hypothetical protein
VLKNRLKSLVTLLLIGCVGLSGLISFASSSVTADEKRLDAFAQFTEATVHAPSVIEVDGHFIPLLRVSKPPT